MKLFTSTTLVLALAAGSAAAQSFTYSDFSSVVGINFVGKAKQTGVVAELMDNVAPVNGTDNRGAAWYATPVCVSGGFDTTFTYQTRLPSSTGGADGFAFVIQNDQVAGSPIIIGAPDGTGNLAIGRHAAAIGYGNFATSLPGETVDNSVAVEFDTFANTAAATWGDADGNHISIHTGGSGDNGTHEDFSIGRALNAAIGGDLNLANSVRTVRIVYTPGAPGTLDVYWQGALKVSVPYSFATGGTWLNSGNPVGGLNLIGGTSAYVGFTASAGSVREFREILSWTWTSTCPNTPTTSFCDGSAVGTTCLGCGNNGLPGNGCANFGFPGGGHLSASGIAGASIGTDTLVLTASDITGPGLFFQADGLSATPISFGDGMLCAAVNIVRMGVVFPNGLGVASYPGGLTPNPIHIAGAAVSGQTKHYQCWFRDSGETSPGVSFCTPATYNLTQGLTLTWTP